MLGPYSPKCLFSYQATLYSNSQAQILLSNMTAIFITIYSHKNHEQAEAEVVPSTSLVEIEVEVEVQLGVEVKVEVEVGVEVQLECSYIKLGYVMLS